MEKPTPPQVTHLKLSEAAAFLGIPKAQLARWYLVRQGPKSSNNAHPMRATSALFSMAELTAFRERLKAKYGAS